MAAKLSNLKNDSGSNQILKESISCFIKHQQTLNKMLPLQFKRPIKKMLTNLKKIKLNDDISLREDA